MSPEDIFIVKPFSSNDHDIYFCKDYDSLEHLVADLKSTQQDSAPVPYILQKALPHFGICIKHYYYAGVHTFNYQQSLGPDYFDKSIGPQFGKICRKLEYNQQSQKLDEVIDFESLKRLMVKLANSQSYHAIGFDLLLSEKDHSYVLIDVNQYPGALVIDVRRIKSVFESYINRLFLEKKQEFFPHFDGKNGFYAGQSLSLQAQTLTFRLAFIHRQFPVARTSGLAPGSYLLTSIDGNNQKKDEIARGWFQQGYLGTVIKLQKIQQGESHMSSISEIAFILTEETVEKHQSLTTPFLSLKFEELANLCDLLREGDVLEIN